MLIHKKIGLYSIKFDFKIKKGYNLKGNEVLK